MAQDTRSRLVTAAIGLLRERGYAATGTLDILAAAEAPKGSLYHFFDGKEALAAEAVAVWSAREVEWAEEILGETGRPPLERLRDYLAALIARVEDEGVERGSLLGVLGQEVGPTLPRLQAALREGTHARTGRLAALLAEARRRGDLRRDSDPEALAAMVLSIWEGVLWRARLERRPELARVAYDAVLSILPE